MSDLPPTIQRNLGNLSDGAISFTTSFSVRRIYQIIAIFIKFAVSTDESITITYKSGISPSYDTIIFAQKCGGAKDFFFSEDLILDSGDQIQIEVTKTTGSDKVGITVQAKQWLTIQDPS